MVVVAVVCPYSCGPGTELAAEGGGLPPRTALHVRHRLAARAVAAEPHQRGVA